MKKPTQKETVLAMLEQAGPEGVTSNQFYAACLPRFGARIHELKGEGHSVVKEPVEDGHFRYILVGRSTTPQQSPPDLGEVGNSPPNLGEGSAQSPGEATRRGGLGPSEPTHWVGRPTASSSRLLPGQLFEVIEDGPTGPVNPYEWEAA